MSKKKNGRLSSLKLTGGNDLLSGSIMGLNAPGGNISDKNERIETFVRQGGKLYTEKNAGRNDRRKP